MVERNQAKEYKTEGHQETACDGPGDNSAGPKQNFAEKLDRSADGIETDQREPLGFCES